jgi:Xaa-Pro aminopeptidase
VVFLKIKYFEFSQNSKMLYRYFYRPLIQSVYKKKGAINMSENEIFNQRIRFPIPTRELERRWNMIRTAMKMKGIDLLIMQNDNQFLGGYVRYLTDIPAEQAYPVSVLFPADEEMMTITSASPTNPLPQEWASRGIKTRFGAPYFRSLCYTNEYDAEVMVKVIKDRKDQNVGIVGMGLINAALFNHLKENLPHVAFTDATNLVDEIKAVKSEDELVYVRKAIDLHDWIAAAMPSIMRPGIYEYALRSELQRILVNQGSEEQLIMLGSAPASHKTPHLHSFFQNRRVEDGDNVLVMVEANGPGGFYGEIIRTWCLGEPSQALLDAWEISRKIQHYAASLLKPGVCPAEVIVKVNERMINQGYEAEGRLFGHGQGYDLVERPAFSPKETMVLRTNMVVALHPVIANAAALGFCCDDYLITEDGAIRMQKTPQEVFVL